MCNQFLQMEVGTSHLKVQTFQFHTKEENDTHNTKAQRQTKTDP